MIARAQRAQLERGIGRSPDTVARDLSAEGRVQVQLDPYNFPPRGAIPFDLRGPDPGGATPNQVAPGTTATILTTKVGDGLQLRIAGIGFSALSPTALVWSLFSIFVNGNPAPGYANIAAGIGSLEDLAPIDLHVPGPATIDVKATNLVPSGLSFFFYFTRIRGWLFTEAQ